MQLHIHRAGQADHVDVVDADRDGGEGRPLLVARVYEPDVARLLAQAPRLLDVCRKMLGPNVIMGTRGAVLPLALYRELANAVREADRTCRVRVQ